MLQLRVIGSCSIGTYGLPIGGKQINESIATSYWAFRINRIVHESTSSVEVVPEIAFNCGITEEMTLKNVRCIPPKLIQYSPGLSLRDGDVWKFAEVFLT